MTLSLILTNDWEIFGDGSGDYFELQHRPLENLLKMLDSVGGKISIMAEVGQQLAMKSIAGHNTGAADIANAWEEMLRQTIKHGSDVQLHYHPQWDGARYENGKWVMDMSKWALSSLSPEVMKKNLSTGKEYLEMLLQPVNPDYRCMVFRAGAHCIQPAAEPIKALKGIGIKCDTSVLPGMHSGGFYDFRDSVSNVIPWYSSANDVNENGSKDKGLLELPIYTTTGWNSEALRKYYPKLYYSMKFGTKVSDMELSWQSEKERVKNIRYPRSQRYYKKEEKKNIAWYVSKIVSGEPVKLDYDFLPADVFVKMLKDIFRDKSVKQFLDKDITLPVVAIGHLKDIHNLDNIARIHDNINREMKDTVSFGTLSQAVDDWNKPNKE